MLNLSKDAVLKPVWVPLDLRYGVNDQLEVFVSHTGPGTAIATGGSPLGGGGGGVCIGGTDRGCPKFYNNINVGAQYSLMKSGGIELTGIGALEFRQLSDPMELAIDVGVGFKYISAPIAIRATPVIGIGVNNRDVGNKEYISVPVQSLSRPRLRSRSSLTRASLVRPAASAISIRFPWAWVFPTPCRPDST